MKPRWALLRHERIIFMENNLWMSLFDGHRWGVRREKLNYLASVSLSIKPQLLPCWCLCATKIQSNCAESSRNCGSVAYYKAYIMSTGHNLHSWWLSFVSPGFEHLVDGFQSQSSGFLPNLAQHSCVPTAFDPRCTTTQRLDRECSWWGQSYLVFWW